MCLPCTAAEERKRVEEETEAKREEHKQEQAKLAAQRRAEAEAARKKAEADAAAAAEQAAADAAAAQAGGEAAAQEGDGAAQEVGQSDSAAYGSSVDSPGCNKHQQCQRLGLNPQTATQPVQLSRQPLLNASRQVPPLVPETAHCCI